MDIDLHIDAKDAKYIHRNFYKIYMKYNSDNIDIIYKKKTKKEEDGQMDIDLHIDAKYIHNSYNIFKKSHRKNRRDRWIYIFA